MIFQGYLLSILYGLLCLAIGFALYKLHVPKPVTRKVVHILIGFEWFILYRFFGGGIHFLIVCLLFLGILLLAHRNRLLPMIESEGDNSPGTVYYALAMSIMALITLFLPDMILPFGVGVLCTSLGDGLAGLIGQAMHFPKNAKIYGNKTIYGTLFNFIACGIATGVFNRAYGLGLRAWHIFAIAIFATILEIFTGRGLDNVTVTLGASFLAYFFVNFPGAENYLVPILLTPLIIAFAYKKKALTVSGIIAAIAVDIVISVTLGNFGFTVLLAFFACGIAVDKIKKHSKKAGQSTKCDIEKRGDCRDHVQVLANSLVASVLAVLYFLTDNRIFIIAFVASLAEALADTAASGIGVLYGKAFDPFRMRPCAPGVSGGMSLLGTAASAVGAILIALIGLAFNAYCFTSTIIIAVSATIGAIFDSFLGSLVQVKYKCQICDSITEREEHCGSPTAKHSGLRFVNNDTVNLLGSLFAALLSALLYMI